MEEEFDGMYLAWFTPEELDLTMEALGHYEKAVAPDKAKRVHDLLVAANKLKEEGLV